MKKEKRACVSKYAPVGGQAVMEGILMKAPGRSAFVVRRPDGSMFIETADAPAGGGRKFSRLPLIRGIAAFFSSLTEGYRAMARSAELAYPGEETASAADRKKEERQAAAAAGAGALLGVLLAVVLMIFLPALLADLFSRYICDISGSRVLRSLLEGVIKIVIFAAYIAACSASRDIKRVFMYHGAEHKTIFCYEHKLPLTVENVRAQSRFHPRCGTSFIVLMVAVGVVAAAFIPQDFGIEPRFANVLVRTLCKLLTLPVVMGVGYELLKLCGRYDNAVTRIIAAPGLWFQRLTTKEPSDDGILEVGIVSLESALGLPLTVPVRTAGADGEEAAGAAAEPGKEEPAEETAGAAEPGKEEPGRS